LVSGIKPDIASDRAGSDLEPVFSSSFKAFGREGPLNASMKALSVGFPGREKST
jgi:hypothetical protein